MTIFRRSIVKVALAGSLVPAAAYAQAVPHGLPNHPLRLVVPFSPGGPTDLVGRYYAQALGAKLGRTVVVDNRAGASGAIGTQEAARAPKDGLTLLLGTSSTHATNPTAMRNPGYDALEDFTHLAVLGLVPIVVAVNPSVPAQTLAELVALIRAEPDRYPYATAGTGSITHLAGEMLKLQAGHLEATHIPYRGSAPAMQDVISGTVPWFVETFSTTLPQHRDGRLRIISVLSANRASIAPEVGTAAESGFPELIANTFNVVCVPAGTPDAAIATLLTATQQVMAEATFAEALRGLGVEPLASSDPASARAYVKQEIERWRPIIIALDLQNR